MQFTNAVHANFHAANIVDVVFFYYVVDIVIGLINVFSAITHTNLDLS